MKSVSDEDRVVVLEVFYENDNFDGLLQPKTSQNTENLRNTAGDRDRTLLEYGVFFKPPSQRMPPGKNLYLDDFLKVSIKMIPPS